MISEIIDCDNETARSLENIEKLIFGTAWNYEIIQEKIKNKKFKYWIYEVENSIKGYLGIQFLEEEDRDSWNWCKSGIKKKKYCD